MYAQKRAVLIVASAGNAAIDLRHPGIDGISPDWPAGAAVVRDVANSCRVARAELTGVVTGTSMAALHAAGVAALIAQRHATWKGGALAAALKRSTQPLGCPPAWHPVGPQDQRERCYGGGGQTSFFGSGLVDAAAVAR